MVCPSFPSNNNKKKRDNSSPPPPALFFLSLVGCFCGAAGASANPFPPPPSLTALPVRRSATPGLRGGQGFACWPKANILPPPSLLLLAQNPCAHKKRKKEKPGREGGHICKIKRNEVKVEHIKRKKSVDESRLSSLFCAALLHSLSQLSSFLSLFLDAPQQQTLLSGKCSDTFFFLSFLAKGLEEKAEMTVSAELLPKAR